MSTHRWPGGSGWRAVPFFVLAILCLWNLPESVQELIRLNRLRQQGRDTTATVVDTGIIDHRLGRESYWMRYQFTPRDLPQAYVGADDLRFEHKAEWDESFVSKHAAVRYLPDDPTINRLASAILERIVSTRISLVVMTVAGMILVAGGVAVVRISSGEFRRWWFSA